MLGKIIEADNSKLFSGPLGVIRVGFGGYNLGTTNADSMLSIDEDIKDIIHQQSGTKPNDYVRTGIELTLKATFSEISSELVSLLMSGMSKATSTSGTLGRSVYQSMRETEAKGLRIAALDANGSPSTDEKDVLNFYEAIAIPDGEVINWGADSQRNLPVTFKIVYHVFAEGESVAKYGAFGYWGDPITEDVPPIDWVDAFGAKITSANASSATVLDITFDKNIAFQTIFNISSWTAKVNGAFVQPLSGVITDNTIAVTFAGATFASNDEIELSIGENELQDTSATPILFIGVDAYRCTDSI